METNLYVVCTYVVLGLYNIFLLFVFNYLFYISHVNEPKFLFLDLYYGRHLGAPVRFKKYILEFILQVNYVRPFFGP